MVDVSPGKSMPAAHTGCGGGEGATSADGCSSLLPPSSAHFHLPPSSPLLPLLLIIVIIIQWLPVFKGAIVLADNSVEAVKG